MSAGQLENRQSSKDAETPIVENHPHTAASLEGYRNSATGPPTGCVDLNFKLLPSAASFLPSILELCSLVLNGEGARWDFGFRTLELFDDPSALPNPPKTLLHRAAPTLLGSLASKSVDNTNTEIAHR